MESIFWANRQVSEYEEILVWQVKCKLFNPVNFKVITNRFFVPLTPLRGELTIQCNLGWQPTLGLTEFALGWRGAGFKPGTAAFLSGVQYWFIQKAN